MNPASILPTSSSSTSSTSAASLAMATPVVTSVIPSTDNPGAVHKQNLTIALGSLSGVLGLLLILSVVYFCYLSRRRRRNLAAWTIDSSSSDGDSLISNTRNRRGYSRSGDIYPLVEPYRHSMEQTADGNWRNFNEVKTYRGISTRTLNTQQVSPSDESLTIFDSY